MKTNNHSITIKGSELKKALDKLVFDEDVFEVSADYFWEMDSREKYDNVETKPKEFTLGQVTEEWEFVQKAVGDEDYYPVNNYLSKLGRVLKAIGDTVDQVDTNEHREKQEDKD